jgi:hypothetical protein
VLPDDVRARLPGGRFDMSLPMRSDRSGCSNRFSLRVRKSPRRLADLQGAGYIARVRAMTAQRIREL